MIRRKILGIEKDLMANELAHKLKQTKLEREKIIQGYLLFNYFCLLLLIFLDTA